MKKTKFALFQSILALLLCVSMLAGTTFALFTDSETSGNNIITSGNLKVGLDWAAEYAADETQWTDASEGAIFNYEYWEPGYTDTKYVRISNQGNLALTYRLHIVPDMVEESDAAELAEVIDVYLFPVADANGDPVVVDRAAIAAATPVGTLADLMLDPDGAARGVLLPEKDKQAKRVKLNEEDAAIAEEGAAEYCLVLKMQEDAGNEYQNKSAGNGFSVQLLAAQYTYEQDSFGNDYDTSVEFPELQLPMQYTVAVTPDAEGKVAEDLIIGEGKRISAIVPKGVQLEEGVTELTLSVKPVAESQSNVQMGQNDISQFVDVHISGVAAGNTLPITVTLLKFAPTGQNMGNLRIYHVEGGSTNPMTLVPAADPFTAHNQFKYDPATGDVSLYMATFSEVTVLADKTAAWESGVDHSWYDASKTALTIANADQLWSFSQIVGGMADGIGQDSFNGKTVTLISDINLADGEESNMASKIFYPIGYYNSEGTYEKTGTAITSGFKTFEGTFNGAGHTIANIYQSTWEMKGDNEYYAAAEQHYRDGMGLFGKVYGGTVENLTVKNFKSDGEYTTTGVIAAYADSVSGKPATFKNIAIVDCNPRVYNIGNGGIVGCGGWYSKDTKVTNAPITFKNITVDKTNKISALWGSYDVACGGIMGQYYPNSGCGVSFENCHVAAQMDVYNDVCGNYQYYAYRYAGMMIGSIRNNVTTEDGKTIPDMTGISASGCTVNYGDWNDYFYCEFVENTQASYTHDYQMSRVPNSEIDTSKGKENATCNGHNHEEHGYEDVNGTRVLVEDKQAVYLPFHQLFTGYGWGVNSVGLEKYSGITIKDLGITEGDQNESVTKFETKLTGDFLYRVGNGNAVPLSVLFAEKAGTTILDSGVYVSIEKMDDKSTANGTFTANTTEWEKGTLKFEGTGVVKVTIQDYNFCLPTVLYLEIVGANNHTSESISRLNGNTVLLCNTKLNNSGSLALVGASLYGNGFELDVSAGKTAGESVTANYLLHLNNGTLDNVRIKGAVYTQYAHFSSDSYNNPTVLSIGNSRIINCYISNCAAPVRVRSGNVYIANTTLKGGNLANLDIRGGHVTLDNVTTINQLNLNDKASDGTEVAGLGILVYFEGPSDDTIVEIKGKLTQHNSLRDDYKPGNLYAQQLIETVFDSQYGSLHYTDSNGTTWANTGILSIIESVDADNIINAEQTNKGDYTGQSVTYEIPGSGTVKGYLYTIGNKAPNDNVTDLPNGQDNIIPKVSFDHSVNARAGEEGTCISDPQTDVETITFPEGGSFDWNVNILKCSNKDISYTVWMNGVQYTDKITFDQSGDYEIVFKYSDPVNYRVNDKGEIEKYTVNYEKTMGITVAAQKQTAKNAEITFPLLESYGTTKVTVDGKTYIMPNLTGTNIPKYGDDLTFDASTRKYGSLKADGKTSEDIYYPIIQTEMVYSGLNGYMVFPVFGNKNGTLVQIVDYADEGTGDALTPYNASTKTMPAGLSISRGYTVQWKTDDDVVGSGEMNYGSWTGGDACFKYQSSSDTIACKDMGGYLSYYPDINLSTNKRNEQVMVAEYKYVDNKNDTYYYCVGYHIKEKSNGYGFDEYVPEDQGCVTPDTLVTLADGTKKEIQYVTHDDELLVWDFYTGTYACVPASIIWNHGVDEYTVITLRFDDGTVVNAINTHGFFDADENNFVYITDKNVKDYVGHNFVKVDGNSYTTVKLVDFAVERKVTGCYSLQSAVYNNFVVEDMFSMTTPDYEGWFDYFNINDDMKYDEEHMQSEIAKYGLTSYEEVSYLGSYELYVALNARYLNILIGRGVVTMDEVIEMLQKVS